MCLIVFFCFCFCFSFSFCCCFVLFVCFVCDKDKGHTQIQCKCKPDLQVKRHRLPRQNEATGWHCHTAGRRDILEEKQLYNSSPPEKIIHNMQRFSRYHCRGQTVVNTAKGFLVPPLWRIYSGCKCFVRIMNLCRHSA